MLAWAASSDGPRGPSGAAPRTIERSAHSGAPCGWACDRLAAERVVDVEVATQLIRSSTEIDATR